MQCKRAAQDNFREQGNTEVLPDVNLISLIIIVQLSDQKVLFGTLELICSLCKLTTRLINQ